MKVDLAEESGELLLAKRALARSLERSDYLRNRLDDLAAGRITVAALKPAGADADAAAAESSPAAPGILSRFSAAFMRSADPPSTTASPTAASAKRSARASGDVDPVPFPDGSAPASAVVTPRDAGDVDGEGANGASAQPKEDGEVDEGSQIGVGGPRDAVGSAGASGEGAGDAASSGATLSAATTGAADGGEGGESTEQAASGSLTDAAAGKVGVAESSELTDPGAAEAAADVVGPAAVNTDGIVPETEAQGDSPTSGADSATPEPASFAAPLAPI